MMSHPSWPIDRRGFVTGGLGAAAGLVLPGAATAATRPRPYLLGADISWLPEDEAAGATYRYQGRAWDLLALLRHVGFNAIKVRTFVDPAAPGGYSADAPSARWAGLERTVALGRRVKAAGFDFSLSLHFSDDWADPQKQVKPAAWAAMPPAELAAAVEAYSRRTVAALVAAGAAPDMVVVGNETTFGMLWPDGRVPLTRPTGNPVTDRTHLDPGRVGGFDGFATLLKSGIAGTRAAAPGAKIVLHNHLGRHWPTLRDWTDALRAQGVRFDAIGLSCYQQAAEGDWARSFTEFCRRYPDCGLLVAEYSSRKRYVNDLVHNLPNGQGWGSYIWEPTRHQEAIFDRGGRSAGEGPRPNLIAQGLNSAEAPGDGAPPGKRRRTYGVGGRYDGNEFLDLYRRIATDYGLR
jgi:arabinogalactan endo-1,4-beta-galactosidase